MKILQKRRRGNLKKSSRIEPRTGSPTVRGAEIAEDAEEEREVKALP